MDCPKCGSIMIIDKWGGWAGWVWTCFQCGYGGRAATDEEIAAQQEECKNDEI